MLLARSPRRRLALVCAALAACAPLLSGCGLGTAGGYVPGGRLAGPLSDVKPLDGAAISIGSKNFSENILLGKMALILLKADGATVTDLTNIPGSSSARQAHLEGQIDAMWEYTGTGWITYLGHDKPITDERQQYEAVRKEDAAQNSLDWLAPAPMNNTYGFALTEASAKKYGITKLSEMRKIPVKERTFCVESEFANRPDGLEGMLTTYGVPRGKPNGVPDDNIGLYQTGAVYDATAKGKCTFGEVFTTDGRILALHLKVLEDDKVYFPNYNVSLVVRDAVLQAHPAIRQLIEPVTRKLTNDVLLRLNAEIDVKGREPADVAAEWLRQEGFLAT
jgi:osmoprotectant transport system substrate-binding protein